MSMKYQSEEHQLKEHQSEEYQSAEHKSEGNHSGEYQSYDGRQIFYVKWQAQNEIAVLQIAHGLGEMADYYEEFAKLANDHHITVYLNEARGHGRTRAAYNSENIIEQYVKDVVELNRQIKKTYTDKPLFILGHSLGSVVTQLAILEYPQAWNGLILTGMPYQKNISELMKEVSREIVENGENADSISTFLKLFANINDSFPESEGSLAWLTSDEERRAYYIDLPYTNILYSNRFYRDFLEKSKEVQETGIVGYEDQTVPIAILGGESDVISENGTYGKTVTKKLKNTGFTNVSNKIYPQMRHSILQERNREQVFEDIAEWIGEISQNFDLNYK